MPGAGFSTGKRVVVVAKWEKLNALSKNGHWLAINQEVSYSTSSTDDNRDDVGDNDAGFDFSKLAPAKPSLY